MRTDNLSILDGQNGHVERVTAEGIPISDSEPLAQRVGIRFNDILFILFRHKWKIILCALAGFAAAAGVYFLLPSLYESKAKLIVRYVVDHSAVDNIDNTGKTLGSPSDSVITAEVEILTSLDVATQVADALGPQRLVKESKGIATPVDGAREILRNLEVTAVKGSNIISIAYKDSDPKLASEVLEQLVKFYFDKHLEVHRSAGSFDLVARQTKQLQKELSQTEEDLKNLKATAGMTSPAEDTAAVSSELTKTQQELDAAQTELAAQQARVNEIEKSVAGMETKPVDGGVSQPSGPVIEEYRSLVNRLTQLRQTETELLSKYTVQNRTVKVKQGQIEELEKQRQEFEQKYPGILATVPIGTSAESGRQDMVSERARLVGFQAQTKMLESRLGTLQERSKVLAEYGPRIEALERTKAVQDTNYKYLQASLEKAQIDETLDPSKIPNISMVQKPSPAEKATRDVKKLVLALAVGGLAIGIAMALLIELVFDRTVKRAYEFEEQLQIPLLLSIPYFGTHSQQLRLYDERHNPQNALEEDEDSEVVQTEDGDLLQPFCEAIRDRMGLFFQLNHMAHKPKLVAVTGLTRNAGASTLAAGLATSLSDTAESKVLLVDKPGAPKRFYDMLTQFRTSDLDYVVFDMPSLGNTSATLPLAGFMDIVLLVVEAEKNNRDSVKRAYAQLAARTKVSVVFNKSRSYGPRWLEGEI
jgi:succinoglycan biosynthesis transport protein ExoP